MQSAEPEKEDGTIQDEINFKVGLSKNLIDQIDLAIAQYYNFTPTKNSTTSSNYDIKYRMGLNGGRRTPMSDITLFFIEMKAKMVANISVVIRRRGEL